MSLGGTSGPRNGTQCGNPNQQPHSFSRPKVAAPYVANNASGPVRYLQLTATHADGVPVGDANSIELNDPGNAHYNYTVTVGLPKPLSIANYTDDPLVLRLGSPSGSQNQAWDCDNGINSRKRLRTDVRPRTGRTDRSGRR